MVKNIARAYVLAVNVFVISIVLPETSSSVVPHILWDGILYGDIHIKQAAAN